MTTPTTRYARNGQVHLAYQVFGDGPRDILFVTSWITQVEHLWEQPHIAGLMRRLGTLGRVVIFDRRGSGMSDRVPFATLEEQVDDVRAVLAAAGVERAVVLSESEGTALACMFAAAHPQQVEALALHSPIARFVRDDDYPIGWTAEERELWIEQLYWHWGEGMGSERVAPSMPDQEGFVAWWAKMERLSAGPAAVRETLRVIGRQDVRRVLPLIRVPTLVVARPESAMLEVRHAQYVAEAIPGARLVEVGGRDQLIAVKSDELIAHLEQFLGLERPAPEARRALATVLFTDIVGSTEQAARLGDRAWAGVLEEHRQLVRAELALHGGREVKTLGDGFLALFDGPARAIRCALSASDRSARAGVEMRAGLHTGECELEDGDVSGIAVHLAARVLGKAAPGEVLVSRTVADLVAGSGLALASRGTHELRGVPGAWELYAAAA